VKVFLLPLQQQPSVFYSEDDDEDAAEGSSPSSLPGLHGWVVRTTHRLKTSLKHPKSQASQRLKRAWDWLHKRMHPDEPLLAALRSARTIEVYHPESMAGDEARDLWMAYLRRRLRRHIPWLMFNLVFSPLTILLTPLPGPNVIGYWFAYRAVHHLLILRGIRRILSGRVGTTFRPVADLDATGAPGDREWLARTAARHELKGLHEFVARIAPGPASLPGEAATRGTQQPCDC